MKRKKNKFRINSHNLGKFKIKHKLFAFFCVFIFLLILYIQKLALPIVIKNTETQLKAYATRSINYAVAETMNQNISYGDLIKIVKNENNDVDYIEANSIRINVLSKSMSKVVMANFLEFSKRPIKISLGSFSGISAEERAVLVWIRLRLHRDPAVPSRHLQRHLHPSGRIRPIKKRGPIKALNNYNAACGGKIY